MAPLLTICTIVYNQEKFIAQALEGFVSQLANFEFEAIVADDCSTDNTAKIIAGYAEKYPGIIKPTLRDKNVGMSANFSDVLSKATGRYIALCDGDDYWTDPDKLQKQVNFLEANPEYSICCHRYKIYDEEEKTWHDDYGSKLFMNNISGIEIDIDMYFKQWLTKSVTVVIRKDLRDLTSLKKYRYFRDVHWFFNILQHGKGYCLNFDGAVYRKHLGGIHSKISEVRKLENQFKVFEELNINNPTIKPLKIAYLDSWAKVLYHYFKNNYPIYKRYSSLLRYTIASNSCKLAVKLFLDKIGFLRFFVERKR